MIVNSNILAVIAFFQCSICLIVIHQPQGCHDTCALPMQRSDFHKAVTTLCSHFKLGIMTLSHNHTWARYVTRGKEKGGRRRIPSRNFTPPATHIFKSLPTPTPSPSPSSARPSPLLSPAFAGRQMAPPFVFPSSLKDLERDTDGDDEPSLRPQNPVAVASLRAADLEEFVKGTYRRHQLHFPDSLGSANFMFYLGVAFWLLRAYNSNVPCNPSMGAYTACSHLDRTFWDFS